MVFRVSWIFCVKDDTFCKKMVLFFIPNVYTLSFLLSFLFTLPSTPLPFLSPFLSSLLLFAFLFFFFFCFTYNLHLCLIKHDSRLLNLFTDFKVNTATRLLFSLLQAFSRYCCHIKEFFLSTYFAKSFYYQ